MTGTALSASAPEDSTSSSMQVPVVSWRSSWWGPSSHKHQKKTSTATSATLTASVSSQSLDTCTFREVVEALNDEDEWQTSSSSSSHSNHEAHQKQNDLVEEEDVCLPILVKRLVVPQEDKEAHVVVDATAATVSHTTTSSPRPRRRSLLLGGTNTGHASSSRRLIMRKSPSSSSKEKVLPVVQEPGFPGSLTDKEKKEVEFFRSELARPENVELRNIVQFYKDLEPEDYAVCRYLRATKFDARKILDRLHQGQEAWVKAQEQAFYSDLTKALGHCLPATFRSQYPFCTMGRSKEGYPVSYLLAGRINPEGVLSIIDLETAAKFFWHQSAHVFPKHFAAAQAAMTSSPQASLVRTESIVVIDLKGLSASALGSDSLEVISLASTVADYFPETMHGMVLLNAPRFFAFSWPLIKKCIDPRTAKRIQVFSSPAKGMAKLQEMIDLDQLASDYGGTNCSVDVGLQTCDDANAVDATTTSRKPMTSTVNVLHVTLSRAHKVAKCEYVVQAGERLSLTVFTRSGTPGRVSVFAKEQHQEEKQESMILQGKWDATLGKHVSNCHADWTPIAGPATVIVQVEAIKGTEAAQPSSSSSKGYFVAQACIESTSN